MEPQTGEGLEGYDYDAPSRYRLGAGLTARVSTANLYETVARRVVAHGAGTIVDVGSGEGQLGAAIGRQASVVSCDRSITLLGAIGGVRCAGDARQLPFASGSVDAVVAINVLYHLSDPDEGIVEARRVLRPGGLFAVATVSRDDSPELAHALWVTATSFDAEDAEAIVRHHFPTFEIDRWDAPLVRLPDESAVRDFLSARSVPLETAIAAAREAKTPMWVTKRGLAIYATRPG